MEDLSKLKVPELKAKCKERGLPVSGSKADLLARLNGESTGTKRKAEPKEKKSPAKKQKTADSEDEESGDGESEASEETKETDFTTPAVSEGEIKVVTWNVASWNAVQGKGLKEYLKNEDPDIICFNETKIDQAKVPEDKIPGYHAYFYSCEYNAGYAGTAILSKTKPLSVKYGIGVKEHDTEGRCITAEYEKFYLIATYIPNAGEKDKDTKMPKNLSKRLSWDEAFQKYLKDLDAKKPIVWCGDLNVAHKEIDLKNPKTNTKTAGFTKEERDSFDKFLSTGFVDSYRHYYPKETDCYTFWAYRGGARQKGIGWRLDYFVCSERFLPSVTNVFIRKYVMGSDHCPLGCTIKLSD